MKTAYVTCFIASPFTSVSLQEPNSIMSFAITAALYMVQSGTDNAWHNVIHPDNLIADNAMKDGNGTLYYVAFGKYGDGTKVNAKDFCDAMLTTADMSLEGPYAKVTYKDTVYDILWVPIDEE